VVEVARLAPIAVQAEEAGEASASWASALTDGGRHTLAGAALTAAVVTVGAAAATACLFFFLADPDPCLAFSAGGCSALPSLRRLPFPLAICCWRLATSSAVRARASAAV